MLPMFLLLFAPILASVLHLLVLLASANSRNDSDDASKRFALARSIMNINIYLYVRMGINNNVINYYVKRDGRTTVRVRVEASSEGTGEAWDERGAASDCVRVSKR